jgi:anthranilate synthase/aminodeoxychorismate synthase-like glutamine amidotransferase
VSGATEERSELAGAASVRGPGIPARSERDNGEMPRVLVIDNYDSFVYNLVQYLGELGADPVVHRHDAISIEAMQSLAPDAVLISPGPGRPENAGLSNEAIRAFGEHGTPVLGVCLGLQCIGQLYGAAVVRAPRVMHGKTSEIRHTGRGVFRGVPNPITATRYHSLVVERGTVPDVLEITAESEDGLVMGLRHRELPIEGVQFHPESILTNAGHQLLSNFLDAEGAPARA